MNNNSVSSWLLVERLENWKVDKNEGFVRFGISSRHQKRAEQVRQGDKLIFYVSSGISAFSDVREAISDGTKDLRFGGDYDTAFPISLSTKPTLTLLREQWVPISKLIDQLSFTRKKKGWGQVMRQTVRKIEPSDANIIIKAMKRSIQQG